MICNSRSYKICWLVCSIFFIMGLFLMGEDIRTYSTGEYWVANDYKHIYETYSKEIVDVIEDDEVCKIQDNEIVVTRKKTGAIGYAIGTFFVIFSGVGIIYLIYIYVKEKRGEQSE